MHLELHAAWRLLRAATCCLHLLAALQCPFWRWKRVSSSLAEQMQCLDCKQACSATPLCPADALEEVQRMTEAQLQHNFAAATLGGMAPSSAVRGCAFVSGCGVSCVCKPVAEWLKVGAAWRPPPR